MNKRVYVIIFSIILLFSSPLLLYAGVFKDSLGRTVIVPSAPTRIISLAPSITEMVYFLKLGERLVGVTRFSYFPHEARKKPKVGAYTDINVEKVIALNPDLAIATVNGNKREDVEMLEEAGIPVYVINPRRVRQVLDTVERLGAICGVADRAHELAGPLRKRVQGVVRRVRKKPRPLVLLVINVKPLMSVNQSTIHHDIIQLAGGRNLAGEQPIAYPRLSLEEIVRRGPDVIIISSMERGGEFEIARKQWYQWPMLPAVQRGNVYLIDSDLIDRPSPRIVIGLEEMSRLIHPELEWHERQ